MRVRKVRTIVLVLLSVITLIVFRFKRTPSNGNPSQGDSSYLMALSYHEQLNTAIKYELFLFGSSSSRLGIEAGGTFRCELEDIRSEGQENCTHFGQGWTSISSPPIVVV